MFGGMGNMGNMAGMMKKVQKMQSEMKKMQVVDKEGNVSVKKCIPLGITVDERIADGFYFAKSFKIFKHLIENPELLDRPLDEEIDFKV